jgi:hypothetical protein
LEEVNLALLGNSKKIVSSYQQRLGRYNHHNVNSNNGDISSKNGVKEGK